MRRWSFRSNILLGYLFDFLAMGFCLGLAIILVIIFFLAFFGGRDVLITINEYREMWVEAVLFPLWIIMGIITLIRTGRKIRKITSLSKS